MYLVSPAVFMAYWILPASLLSQRSSKLRLASSSWVYARDLSFFPVPFGLSGRGLSSSSTIISSGVVSSFFLLLGSGSPVHRYQTGLAHRTLLLLRLPSDWAWRGSPDPWDIRPGAALEVRSETDSLCSSRDSTGPLGFFLHLSSSRWWDSLSSFFLGNLLRS